MHEPYNILSDHAEAQPVIPDKGGDTICPQEVVLLEGIHVSDSTMIPERGENSKVNPDKGGYDIKKEVRLSAMSNKLIPGNPAPGKNPQPAPAGESGANGASAMTPVKGRDRDDNSMIPVKGGESE